jgi:hypothetical protein
MNGLRLQNKTIKVNYKTFFFFLKWQTTDIFCTSIIGNN